MRSIIADRKISFVIPGIAVPWHRPQQARRFGLFHTYKHNADRRWQGDVRKYAMANRPVPVPVGPVVLDVQFVLPRPKSLSKNVTWHIKKPDLDNLVKSVKDAMNGIMYKDDAQVAEEIVEKRYCYVDESPCVVVHVGYIDVEKGAKA